MSDLLPSLDYDDNDLHSAALCAWKEARGEGPQGMRAVLHVLKNRCGHPGFAGTLHEVIYGKNQFTSMSVPSDPEFNLEPPRDADSWLTAQQFADQVFKNDDQDNTFGAHYYANMHNVTSGWFFEHIVKQSHDHPILAQIGKHTFFM